MRRLALVPGLLLMVTACSRAPRINQAEIAVGDRWNAVLSTPAALVGAVRVTGTGWLGADQDPSMSRAGITITGAFAGAEHPWHVHVGRCGSNGEIVGDVSAYRTLKVGGSGRAESTALVALPFPRSGEYYINVHASPANLATVIACGNLAPPAR